MSLPYAEGDLSDTNASISSDVGGRPIKSKVTLRMSSSLMAGGAGATPSASKRARMNRSTAVRTQATFFTIGGTVRWTGRNAQCVRLSVRAVELASRPLFLELTGTRSAVSAAVARKLTVNNVNSAMVSMNRISLQMSQLSPFGDGDD